jgi:hypothetical protein
MNTLIQTAGVLTGIELTSAQRLRLIGLGNLARRLCVGASAATGTDPLTVRIDLDAR